MFDQLLSSVSRGLQSVHPRLDQLVARQNLVHRRNPGNPVVPQNLFRGAGGSEMNDPGDSVGRWTRRNDCNGGIGRYAQAECWRCVHFRNGVGTQETGRSRFRIATCWRRARFSRWCDARLRKVLRSVATRIMKVVCMPTTVAGGGRECYDFCGGWGFDEAQARP